MKKIYLLFSLFVLGTSLVTAQSLAGKKLYINPGHGGHDSDDRHIIETEFWESEGNLTKGLYVRDMLKALGATVFMSRTLNRTEDDRGLSDIDAEANDLNVHFFHSIHSNATGTANKANYALMMYKEDSQTRKPAFAEAKTMADIMAPIFNAFNRNTDGRVTGDWSFYNPPFNLGVLRTLIMPGTLSEGSFHDYIPESFRLKNNARLKHEAWAIVKSFLKYYGQPDLPFGFIAGIVRDPDLTVNYVALPNTNDLKKPINNITVTVQPGNKIYHGDSFNNGYFMIDSLAPGKYTVYYEADFYYKDSAVVNVNAGQTVFADKYMMLDTTIAPVVTSYSPVYNSVDDSVKAAQEVRITFNRPMNRTISAAAFTISPAVEGTLTWYDDKNLAFVPKYAYDKSTKYTVKITTAAKSIWGVNLDKDYQFSFVTRKRNRLAVVSSYPVDGQREVSQTLQFRVGFDATVTMTSLANNVVVYDDKNTAQDLANVSLSTQNGKTSIVFDIKNRLLEDSDYRLMLSGKIKDADNIPLYDTVNIRFHTFSEKYISGTVIDSFEAAGTWKRPGLKTGSFGIDSLKSSFNITGTPKYNGKYSGRLGYTFTGTQNGACRFYNTNGFALESGNSTSFGMWIKSDMSNNAVEYWFEGTGNDTVKVSADTLNWTGWKLVRVPVTLSAVKKFHSIVIKQLPQAVKNGVIYVDDAQYNIVTPVEENPELTIPENYSLMQNYPNPFNPSTRIKFTLPEAGLAKIIVYNQLGQKVAELVNRELSAGTHETEWNAGSMASGIYFYELRTANFSTTKKMILIK